MHDVIRECCNNESEVLELASLKEKTPVSGVRSLWKRTRRQGTEEMNFRHTKLNILIVEGLSEVTVAFVYVKFHDNH